MDSTPAPETTPCPFCLQNNIVTGQILAQVDGAFLLEANTSPGNYLIIPKNHAESPLDLADTFWREVKQLLPQVPNLGNHLNLSFNVGKLAGQSVKHLHLWVIPRAGNLPSTGKGFASLIHQADQAG